MVNHVIHLVFVALLLPATLAHAQSKYVRRDAQNQQTIVFVHGVPGNSVDTWTNDLTKAYWPTLLAEDSDFSGANIFVVDYSSSCTRLGPSIDELAESLRLALESQGVLRSPEIVFVSHSMGGLVTSTFA